jgi:hypothetical protein
MADVKFVDENGGRPWHEGLEILVNGTVGYKRAERVLRYRSIQRNVPNNVYYASDSEHLGHESELTPCTQADVRRGPVV